MLRNFLIIQLIISLSHIALCQQGWYQLTSGTSYHLRSICFTDVNTGYAVGFNGTILKTTNAGLNWTSQTVGSVENFYSVHFIGQIGYVVGGTNTSVILRTTDGGINWISQLFSGSYELGSVFMTDSVTAHVSGNRRILKTTNGGINWNVQFMDTVIGFPAYFRSIFFVDENTGFVAGSNLMHYGGVFGMTTNGGISWFGGYGSAPASSIYFLNSETGYCVLGGEYRAIKTTNSGQNWNNVFMGNDPLLSIWFVNPATGFAAGSTSNSSLIIKTSNSGLNWNLQTTPAAGALYSVIFIDTNTGFAAGNSGTILKTMNGGVGIVSINNEIPQEYKLFQNFPNPFNPGTNFKFQIPKSSEVKLTVYNIQGKEITTLVNEDLKPGTYEVVWYGENYPSGIYFYRLQTEEFNQTLKMNLIK